MSKEWASLAELLNAVLQGEEISPDDRVVLTADELRGFLKDIACGLGTLANALEAEDERRHGPGKTGLPQ